MGELKINFADYTQEHYKIFVGYKLNIKKNFILYTMKTEKCANMLTSRNINKFYEWYVDKVLRDGRRST